MGGLNVIDESQRPDLDGTPCGGDRPSRMEMTKQESGEYEPMGSMPSM